jgi:hypothetical protein
MTRNLSASLIEIIAHPIMARMGAFYDLEHAVDGLHVSYLKYSGLPMLSTVTSGESIAIDFMTIPRKSPWAWAFVHQYELL